MLRELRDLSGQFFDQAGQSLNQAGQFLDQSVHLLASASKCSNAEGQLYGYRCQVSWSLNAREPSTPERLAHPTAWMRASTEFGVASSEPSMENCKPGSFPSPSALPGTMI